MNGYFSKEIIHTVEKIKIYSTYLVMRKMQSKTTMASLYTTIRSENLTVTDVGDDGEDLGYSHSVSKHLK